MLIYCDSVILTYWLDHEGPYHLRTQSHMAAVQAAGDRVAFSDLTRLECRAGPLKRKDAVVLAAFHQFFARPEVEHVALTSAVFDRAAQLRADHGFTIPDALHLAAAIESGCHAFLTSDARLSRCTNIPIEVLP